MKLKRAIEIQENRNRSHPRVEYPDEWDANQLLIEAGKRLQELRTGKTFSPNISLPSESPR